MDPSLRERLPAIITDKNIRDDIDTLGGSAFNAVLEPNRLPVIVISLPLNLIHNAYGGSSSTEYLDELSTRIQSVNHYNILPLLKTWHNDDTYYLCYEYADGLSLATIMGVKHLSLDEVIRITIEIASALDAMHNHGIVHGHLNPSNILIDNNGRVQVFEFGLANLLPAFGNIGQSPLRNIDWMYPSFFRHQQSLPQDDMFSLGSIVYALLTGRQTFAGPTHDRVADAIMNAEPPLLRDIDGTLPPTFESMIVTMLHKDPEKRCQTMQTLIDELKGSRSNPSSPEPDPVNRAATQSFSSTTSPSHEMKTGTFSNKRSINRQRQEPIRKHWLSFGIVVGIAITLLFLVFLRIGGFFPFHHHEALITMPGMTGEENRRLFLEKKIFDHLKQAEADIDRGRFTMPIGDSAMDAYRAALLFDNNDSRARKGLQELPSRLSEAARVAFEERNIEAVLDFCDQYRQLGVDDPIMRERCSEASRMHAGAEKKALDD